MSMLLSMMLAAADPPMAQQIRAFCKEEAACIATQKQALKHYLGVWVMFDASEAQAEACMRAGKVAKFVDWTKALRCMRGWSRSRENIVAKGMKN